MEAYENQYTEARFEDIEYESALIRMRNFAYRHDPINISRISAMQKRFAHEKSTQADFDEMEAEIEQYMDYCDSYYD